MAEPVKTTERLAIQPAEALANLLETDVPTARLPPLWHTIYLLDRPAQSDLGPDGHPFHGLPPSPGTGARRMFAGGRVRTHAPLHLEQLATRRSEVVSSVDKQGRTGPLTFVTVRHEYQQDGVTAIEAEDDIVYRPAHGPADKMPADARQHLGPPEGEELLTVDIGATFLFRYSALTYNAHRIHYDRDWCAREGYAGLVIHGPLQVLFIAEALRHHSPALLGTQLDYRLVRPLVGEQQVSVRRLPDGGLVVVGADGAVTATATVTRLSGNGPPTGPS